jgi:hypothetical protein
MTKYRYDETWHRLQEWTRGQAVSERLAAQILLHEGFLDLDPSHPLGGKDGGKDAVARKEGKPFVVAVYFPRGQQTFKDIKHKFEGDLAGARSNNAAIAFVTNQELSLSERAQLGGVAAPISLELFHLERITAILDAPEMVSVRAQFLDMTSESEVAIDLGGKGGTALGAGGGGGGALGPNARGGPGGAGGDIHVHITPGPKAK